MLLSSVILLDNSGYYALLGVSDRASFQEIKRAYRRLARRYHPDRNNSSVSDDMIKRINAAFEVLSDKDKRYLYDKADFRYANIRPSEPEENKANYNNRDESSYDSANYNKNENYSRVDDKNNHAQIAEPRRKPGIVTGLLDTPKSRFQISVEPSLCMAFGSCETLAPKVFVVDKNKRINPKAKVESEIGASLDQILAAAQTCPTKAIIIVDRYTGEQIYP
jgi:curved DNA-binding protein CbpA